MFWFLKNKQFLVYSLTPFNHFKLMKCKRRPAEILSFNSYNEINLRAKNYKSITKIAVVLN